MGKINRMILTGILITLGSIVADMYLHQHVLISYYLGISISILIDIVVKVSD